MLVHQRVLSMVVMLVASQVGHTEVALLGVVGLRVCRMVDSAESQKPSMTPRYCGWSNMEWDIFW